MGNAFTRRVIRNRSHNHGRRTYETSKCSSTTCENDSVDAIISTAQMMSVSSKVTGKYSRQLARRLQLPSEKIKEIEVNCRLHGQDGEEITYQILEEWKKSNGKMATKSVLRKALQQIKRKDVVDEVLPIFPEPGEREEMQKYYKGILKKMKDEQRQKYQNIELPQMNWTNRILPLDELYVNLELLASIDDGDERGGRECQLEEMFHEINGKEPVRILIEGGPGFGKTTLCFKLISDWGKNIEYISSKFKMVFLFELRYFKENDSIESVLIRECEAVGVDGSEGIRCIKAFEKETLLILDGFDEMNEECKRVFLPLFQNKVYRSMYVLVTSRRGFFQMEKKKDSEHVGVLEKKNEIQNIVKTWGKRVLIKGVTTDKIETFMRKYLEKDNQDLIHKINSSIEGEMREVFKCPLFLILLAMMLEERKHVKVNTKTTLYKEFFNFVVRRSLVREKKISDKEEVDIFTGCSEHFAVQLIDRFGRFAIECLSESKLLFDEKEILQYCKDEMILNLGFLMKIPKMEGRKRENFYQPIHKSFLEFVAAFALWNLFKTDEQEFKNEMKRIGEKGLKPDHDSLFYIFLGSLMNSQASVLFQSLIHYSSWFNIENVCFRNILLEIKDIHSFYPSFERILDSFIPSRYSIHGFKGMSRDYFLSDIHSLILQYSSDRQLIKFLFWISNVSINLSRDVYVDCLEFHVTNEVFKFSSKEKITSIKCKNIIYRFTRLFSDNQWNDFVSLFNLIQSEKVHFFFNDRWSEFNSRLLELLHQELIKGQWKQKNIDRLRFVLSECDNPDSVSRLVDLVKRNRIKDGIYLEICKPTDRKEEEYYILKRETEELFNSILQSKTIQEFIFDYHCYDGFTPDIDLNRFLHSQLKRFTSFSDLNLYNSNEIENYSLEEVQIMSSFGNENNFNFIQNLQGIKYLCCSFNCLNCFVQMDWPQLKVIEELKLQDFNTESLDLFLNSFSQLTNLQVLSLDVFSFETIPLDSDKLLFVHAISSLRLRICEFLSIRRNFELFSFLTEALMKRMKNKEENNSTSDSNEGRKVYLQELVLGMKLYELNECNGIECIRTMLRKQYLEQCCFLDDYYYNDKKPDVVELLFPWKDKFRISYEVDGMNPNNSRQSQFDYRWFEFKNRFCIKYVNE